MRASRQHTRIRPARHPALCGAGLARWLLPLLSASLIAACGGDSAGSSSPNAAKGGAERVVHGSVAKGPLADATVLLYRLDGTGHRLEDEPLAQTRTAPDGTWSVSLPATDGALLVEARGGRYIDESDPEPVRERKRVISFGPEEGLSAVLPEGVSRIALTVYSQALLEKSRAETRGGEFLDVHASNRALMSAALGFDLVSTLPADPIQPDPGASLASRQYAMALGGAANALNAISIELGRALPSFALVDGLARDLSDCRLDGSGVEGPVRVVVDEQEIVFPAMVSLQREITRFHNNNADEYEGTPLLVLDDVACVASGAVADSIAPVFALTPAAVVVAAVDASGTPSSNPAIVEALSAMLATDDRGEPVSITNDAPEMFPLGLTAVQFVATDTAGNVASAVLELTVADQTRPGLSAPPDLRVAQEGELTQVGLGTPLASDNVSPPGALVLYNDAPVDGFPVGESLVEWTVRDEAGFTTTALQTVTVLSASADADGDGLSDAEELGIGTDPGVADSDGDGLGDGVERTLGLDPVTSATAVVYVAPTGDNANVGDAWETARANNDGIAGIPAGASPAAATVVLYASNSPAPDDAWTLSLTGDCDNIVLIGSISPATGLTELSDTGAPTTRFAIGSGSGVVVNGCENVRIRNLEITGASDSALRLERSRVALEGLLLRHNLTATSGGAIYANETQLEMTATTIAANSASAYGGGIYLEGEGTIAAIEGVLVSGNDAGISGGGLALRRTGASVRVFNGLITANSAPDGAALDVAGGDGSVLANLTVAYNVAGPAGAVLAYDDAGTTGPVLTDSILHFNRDVDGQTGTLAGTVVSDFNLIEQAPTGLNDIDISMTGAGLTAGFFLDQTVSPAVDSGSADAVLLGLDRAYTDPDLVAPAPDANRVDRGYHHAAPYAGGADDFDLVLDGNPDATSAAVGSVLDITPLQNGRLIGPGHAVFVTVERGLVDLRGDPSVDPLGDGNSVVLADRGDGAYQMRLGPSLAQGSTLLRVYVDGTRLDTFRTVVVRGCPDDPARCSFAGPNH